MSEYNYDADIKPLKDIRDNFRNGIPKTHFMQNIKDIIDPEADPEISLPEGQDEILKQTVLFIYEENE